MKEKIVLNEYRVKRAIISVSNKTNIKNLAIALHNQGIEIISTGGTAKILQAEHIPVTPVSEITQFPEMMQGRVKTLHPMIHGAILGKRDKHAKEAQSHNIQWIDLIVCNLYPFAETIKQSDVTFDNAIEQIDIGGPTLIRAGAKNCQWVSVVVDPNDYQSIANELEATNTISFEARKTLAAKAFSHTAQYDAIIANYLQENPYPNTLTLTYNKKTDLRYGENPHQSACIYLSTAPHGNSIATAEQIQGKPLSYNNIVDAESALNCVKEFKQPACVVVKHANPCGVAISSCIDIACTNAFNADSKSAFGGIIALNQECNAAIAAHLSKIFVEVLIAPRYSSQALALLKQKPNLRVLKFQQITNQEHLYTGRLINDGLLMQAKDNNYIINKHELNTVTEKQIDDSLQEQLLFAWQVAKHAKSNAIIIVHDGKTLGIGAGQVSRIDAVDIAIRKAGSDLKNAVLASDAFFPFRDSIDQIAKTAIRAIIQPGGSIRDEEVIAACNEYGIAMVFTNKRCFNH